MKKASGERDEVQVVGGGESEEEEAARLCGDQQQREREREFTCHGLGVGTVLVFQANFKFVGPRPFFFSFRFLNQKPVR